MVVLQVHSKVLKNKYKSFLLTKATLLAFMCWTLSIVLPLFISHRSGGLWLKRDVFYEQPRVKFKGQYLLIATTNNSSKVIICSSLPFYKHFLEFLDECSMIKVRESDYENDGKPDAIYVKFEVNTNHNFKISSIHLILPIDYTIETICPLQMQSAIVYQQYIHDTMSGLSTFADLQFYQRSPLNCLKHHIHSTYNYSIITKETEYESYHLDNIIKNYYKRDVQTNLGNVYTTFDLADKDTFTINLLVKYSEQSIYFNPNVWQIVKYAWIQYFAIYVIVSWVLFKIKSYIFENKWVLYYQERPFIKSNK